jgi:curved DNA-binding protein CbpA
MRDPYTVRGVPRTASEAEVKKAFRALAKRYHPD